MPAGPDRLDVDLGRRVAARFTTRLGGLSRHPYHENNLGAGVGDDPDAVATNRARLAHEIDADVTWARPVHGADVALLSPGRVRLLTGDRADLVEPDPPVDALITQLPGTGVAALAADCVPVLLAGFDQAGQARMVAAVHAGRRGVARGVVPAAVRAMRELGADQVRAGVGPAICGACYEVPAALREEVAAAVPLAWATTSWGTPGLDLPGAVVGQLTEAGVEVRVRYGCTRETDWLYSHRRDQVTGRFAGVVVLRHAGADVPRLGA